MEKAFFAMFVFDQSAQYEELCKGRSVENGPWLFMFWNYRLWNHLHLDHFA